MFSRLTLFILLLGAWFSTTGQLCTKEIVHGKDYDTAPRESSFSTNLSTATEAVRKSLERYGFKIEYVDESRGHFESGWRPVEVDSHYVPLFRRKDYGVTDGAYYKLMVDILEDGPEVRVLVSTKLKSIAGSMKSDGKVERRILDQVAHYLRSPQIEMTNVDVKRK